MSNELFHDELNHVQDILHLLWEGFHESHREGSRELCDVHPCPEIRAHLEALDRLAKERRRILKRQEP
jgi:hypothetical protein